MRLPRFWCTFFFTVIGCFVYDLIVESINRVFWPRHPLLIYIEAERLRLPVAGLHKSLPGKYQNQSLQIPISVENSRQYFQLTQSKSIATKQKPIDRNHSSTIKMFNESL